MKKIDITDKLLKQVETLAGFGLTDDNIALVIGISEGTLKRRFREELDRGRALAKATVAQTAFKMATSGKQPAMTMFWLKTQCRWKETVVQEHVGEDGNPIKLITGTMTETEAAQAYIDNLKT